MSKYSGKAVTLPRPITEIYEKISDLGQYSQLIQQLSEEHRSKLNGLVIEGDTIKMNAPAIGQLVFKISDRQAPNHVNFKAEGAPVPLNLCVNLKEEEPGKTSITPAIDIDLPMMLKPLIGGKIQEAADKFGDVFTSIFK